MSATNIELEKQFRETLNHLMKELDGIRTGRASPALVENVKVGCYQSVMPLKAVASITAPEPRTLVIEVWDASITNDVERALRQADIGAQPKRDGNRLHLVLLTLSEERRHELIRVVGKRTESARISIRTIREDAMKSLSRRKEQEHLSETVVEQEEKEIQKLVDDANRSIGEMAEKKEEELRTV